MLASATWSEIVAEIPSEKVVPAPPSRSRRVLPGLQTPKLRKRQPLTCSFLFTKSLRTRTAAAAVASAGLGRGPSPSAGRAGRSWAMGAADENAQPLGNRDWREPQAPGAGRERRGDGPAGPRDGPDAAALQGEATITGRAGSGRRRGARSPLAGGGGDIAAARSVTGVQPQTRHTAPPRAAPALWLRAQPASVHESVRTEQQAPSPRAQTVDARAHVCGPEVLQAGAPAPLLTFPPVRTRRSSAHVCALGALLTRTRLIRDQGHPNDVAVI
ncbi:unnamed protein product [Rangifer tarandus platyrhynchus]|uniref:Uncharacterized protein n=2 Tax=Rangifer tarandus platyrhynchus TaxID=3082113 RepID=A0ABN8ZJX1_RANTA|nr:unnamed protein product [Rangifer tarandus platyrhynchus]CAI9708308.1 unnamed protein product [Rangifer tarandus platyrhynchus]